MSIIRELARLGNKIDSASTGQFLSKGSTTGSFGSILYTDLTGRPTTLDSSATTSIVDSAYIQARQSAAGGGGLDSALTTQLIDSSYIAARAAAGSSGYQMYEYTATQGQTTFQDSDTNGNILSYSEGGALVFYNGVLLGPSDITATSGSSVVLTTGADSGSHVAIAKWSLASGGSGGATNPGSGDRGIFAGGQDQSTYHNVIDYIDITTPGNATDFGDTGGSGRSGLASCCDGSRMLLAGGYFWSPFGTVNVISYITTSTTGNTTDFGDLTATPQGHAGLSDGTYGVFGGGGSSTTIDYVTVQTTGNAQDFGDLTQGRYGLGATANNTTGLFMGGGATGGNIIEYVTVATPGNATDFGDLTFNTYYGGSCNNGTYAVHHCAREVGQSTSLNTLEYVTIATPGNSADFGDLSLAKHDCPATSNSTTGVIGGGIASNTRLTAIDYFTIGTSGSGTDFGDLTQSRQTLAASSGSPS